MKTSGKLHYQNANPGKELTRKHWKYLEQMPNDKLLAELQGKFKSKRNQQTKLEE